MCIYVVSVTTGNATCVEHQFFLFLAVKHYCYTSGAGNCFKPWKKKNSWSSEIWLLVLVTIFSIGMNHFAKNCWCLGINVNNSIFYINYCICCATYSIFKLWITSKFNRNDENAFCSCSYTISANYFMIQ